MISIGAVYHGPELEVSEVNRSLMEASKALRGFRGGLEAIDTPWVNAVFVVSGSLAHVDFDGLEYGDCSRANKGVVVKVAMSRKIIDGGEFFAFIINSLRGANAMAFEFFRQKGQEFPLRSAEDLVTRTEAKILAG
ncbi:hypothetical protein [Achromobacter sp.]|uniref:hypothetical protein n=1 Tax=Achromobacter sp. TaxID=134375 RepID=UPI0028AECE56|nr:hypothetical protein [Achromobacter sp.]